MPPAQGTAVSPWAKSAREEWELFGPKGRPETGDEGQGVAKRSSVHPLVQLLEQITRRNPAATLYPPLPIGLGELGRMYEVTHYRDFSSDLVFRMEGVNLELDWSRWDAAATCHGAPSLSVRAAML